MEEQRSSSPHEDEAISSSSPSFPFFNHNATTLPNNLPPRVDDKPLARQKRKRTSPEDQAVLEAYYARDPKPDKPARLELVKKVALGEKEVQIWFQNRRQSSRRKSRPLLPHEIAQYQLTKSAGTSEVSSEKPDLDTSQVYQMGVEQHPSGVEENARDDRRPSQDEISSTEDNASKLSPPEQSRPAVEANTVQTTSTGSFSTWPSSQATQYITSFEAPAMTYMPATSLSNQRSVPNLHNHGRPATISVPSPAQPTRSSSPRKMRKVSSFLRLSMNSEGGAEVVAKDASSPSPPRASTVILASTDVNAGSGAGPAFDLTQSQSSSVADGAHLKRASSGRSRDSRAWEFWCDKDGRSELEEKAEKDASGSAADAIQLLRSTSGRNILGPVPAKRNSVLSGLLGTSKRLRRDARGPLKRASTTGGVMPGKSAAQASKAVPKLKSSKSALSVHVPGNDSDKENWSPDSDVHSEGQLVDDSADLEQPERNGHAANASEKRRSAKHRESIDPENDPEIAAFMRAGRESDRVSDHEELDCVQGLLSLSQGNWR